MILIHNFTISLSLFHLIVYFGIEYFNIVNLKYKFNCLQLETEDQQTP